MRRPLVSSSSLRQCLGGSSSTGRQLLGRPVIIGYAAGSTAASGVLPSSTSIHSSLPRSSSSSSSHGFATTAAAAAEASEQSTTAAAPPPPLFEDPRVAILDAALARVPEHGWTEDALAAGAASLGFPAVAHGMFGRGAVELVEHFADRVDAAWLAQLEAQRGELVALPNACERLKLAVQLRLRLLTPQLAQWPQALALGLLPQNLEATAKRLALVADELCFVAAAAGNTAAGGGETQQQQQQQAAQQAAASVDALDWYAQRATVGSVYVATELFFLTDYSEDHADTWAFLDRRLHDLDGLSHAPRSVQEGVLVLHTAAGALASAAASLAQPAVWAAVQRLPVNGALVGALQTALANVAAMAPPAVDPFRPHQPSAGGAAGAGPHGSSSSRNSSPDFPAPSEKDPYAAAPGQDKDAAAGLGTTKSEEGGGHR